MKLLPRYFSLFFCLVLVCLLPWNKLSAQKEQNLLETKLKLFDADKHPLAPEWRYHLKDFVAEDEGFSLRSSAERGRRLLTCKLTYADRVRWSGHVLFDKVSTARNYAYLLLCYLHPKNEAVSEQEANRYDYLALSIGGKGSRHVALVRLSLLVEGDPLSGKIRIDREQNLIASSEFPDPQDLNFDFAVHFDQAKGLALQIRFNGYPDFDLNSDYLEWSEFVNYNQLNSYGFLVNFTKSFRKGMHFSKLAVVNNPQEGSSPFPNEEPNNGDDESKNQLPLMITELMPNPLPASAEYVEVYNPNDYPVDLTPYQLAVGSSSEKVRPTSLRGIGTVLPKSYLVLSAKAKTLIQNYPQCQKENCRQLALRQMANKGCVVYLLHGRDVIDQVIYDPSAFPSGYRSKKGLAFQRIGLDFSENFDADQWQIVPKEGLEATPSEVNPPRYIIRKEIKTKKGTKKSGQEQSEDEYAEFIRILTNNQELNLFLDIYNLMGQKLYAVRGEDCRELILNFYSERTNSFVRRYGRQQTLIWVFRMSLPNNEGQRKRLVLLSYAP